MSLLLQQNSVPWTISKQVLEQGQESKQPPRLYPLVVQLEPGQTP